MCSGSGCRITANYATLPRWRRGFDSLHPLLEHKPEAVRKRIVFVLTFSAILLGAAIPCSSLAVERQQILLDSQTLLPGWQVVTENEKTSVVRTDQGYLLKNFGATTFIYNGEFGYRDYDRLIISLQNSDAVALRIIPNVTTTANYTFENEQTVAASDGVQTVAFSLHYPNFQQVENFGIKFLTSGPANILIQEITLSQSSWAKKLLQPLKDYLRVAPYSGFTVNIFPAPRIFGRSAFVYFLPLFLMLVAALFYSSRFKHKALLGLLVLWLVTDARMGYEFLSYQIADYQTWIAAPQGQKTLRTYGDFYTFIDWLKETLPENTGSVNFHTANQAHFPRLAQYYLYPILVNPPSAAAVYIVYRQPKLIYNHQDQRLYLDDKPVSDPGVITFYDQDSFIFARR